MTIQSFIKILPLLVVFSSGLLKAQVVPGRWEKVDALEQGTEIIFTMKSGERVDGAFQQHDAEILFVAEVNGSERPIPERDVAKVVRPLVEGDSSWDGAAIGAAIGYGGGWAGLAAMKSGGGDWAWSDAFEMFGPIGAGVGALVGYLVDKSHKGTEVLYQAP